MARQARKSSIPSRELFENNPLPMWVFDLETLAFLAVNATAVRQYGYSREEFLAMTIKEIRPSEEIPALLEKVSQPVEGHDAAGIWRHRKKDGTIIDVDIVTHTITFAGRRAKLVLANDVTERKRLEQLFNTAAREWRKTFDAMNEAIAWIDSNGRIVRCNKALTILTNKNYHDIIGHHCEEVVYDTLVPAAACPIKEVMATHKRATATLTSGSRIYQVSADPLFGESGEFIGAIHMMSDITQQERAEKILTQLVLQQKAILNNIPDIAWLKDDQGRFLAANASFGRACGLDPADLVGKTDLDIWPRELAERYRSDDREVMRSRKRKIVEEPLADKEGITAWIETIKTPIIDDEGRVVGTTGIARDITARTRAEAAKKAQMRLAEFGMRIGTALNREGSMQEILGACTDLMVSDLGAAFARIWTVSPDEKMLVLQTSSGIYTHRDGLHGLIPLDKNLKIPTIARTRIPHLTNAVIGDPQVNQEWAAREGMVAFAGYPLLVGNHLVGVMGFFSRQKLNDFTFNALESVANNIALGIERILSEDALKRYSEELSALSTASNDLLALASLPEIYDGICLFAERVFGVELVWLGLIDAGGNGVTIAGYAGAGADYLRTLKVTLDDSPNGSRPTGLAIRSKQPWLARKDSPEYALWHAAAEKCGFETTLAVPLISPTAAGTCIGALNFYSRVPDYFTPDRVRLCQIFANQAAIAIENARLIAGLEEKVDVRTREYESANVELQHVNQELELRRIEAETANEAKSDFLANMSHELRTPLNAIIGFSDIMVRGMAGPLAEKQKEFLGDILSGGKHLLSLINDILDLSKVEAGKMEIEPAEYDPAALIDRGLVLFREKALKHRLDLGLEIEGAIEPVFGDERKIRQVLYNLLSNAVKFTPDGGSVIVRARTVHEDGRDDLEIAVSDTGIGISPEDQKRLFQPFSQLSHHLTKEHEGTGLGLALCKSFVEMHGGIIRVESAPGRGSTFTFKIPLRYKKGV